jgi:signal transduction histidine kinase
VIFLLIAALVTGGLAWVTAEALRLEREQLEARAETELHNKLSLAMWRLDGLISADLEKEARRPFHHYSAGGTTWMAGNKKGGLSTEAIAALELFPMPVADPPKWVLRHFFVALGMDWRSPQVLQDALTNSLNVTQETVTSPVTPQGKLLIDEISNDFDLPRLVEFCRQQEQLLAPHPSQQAGQNTPQSAVSTNESNYNNFQYLEQPAKDSQLRAQIANTRQTNSASYSNRETQGEPGAKAQSQILVIPGPLVRMWLPGKAEERLVVARLIQMGQKKILQVTVLDWRELQGLLAKEVQDLFPEAKFQPMRGERPAFAEREMTALPIMLDPGPQAATPHLGWTPLRIGLLMAWIAALVALSAVGLGGWSLLDLSERRMRFVSAVTHELRTPLTTLRLYLDMLTSGLIKDELQKGEYLQTLHTEADRLTRLVGNVLDFSRLENQRPRLEKRTLALSDFLGQLRRTWEDRCRDAGKELVIENAEPRDTVVCTDAGMAEQILATLLENACKYSRHAEDRRIWLRVRREGTRLLLEVEDRGPGVSPREGRTIFRPFQRGRTADVTAGGVGLGLALASRWARILGGRLSLRVHAATPGACFRLELPGT